MSAFPPTPDGLRAAAAAAIPSDMPITADLLERLAQLADQQTGDAGLDTARYLAAITKAIGDLERRIVDGGP